MMEGLSWKRRKCDLTGRLLYYDTTTIPNAILLVPRAFAFIRQLHSVAQSHQANDSGVTISTAFVRRDWSQHGTGQTPLLSTNRRFIRRQTSNQLTCIKNTPSDSKHTRLLRFLHQYHITTIKISYIPANRTQAIKQYPQLTHGPHHLPETSIRSMAPTYHELLKPQRNPAHLPVPKPSTTLRPTIPESPPPQTTETNPAANLPPPASGVLPTKCAHD